MTLTPLLHLPPYLQIHIIGALISIFLGAFVVLRQRRDRIHKISGYIWTVAMAAVALSSFWIHEVRMIGPFSPLHLLAILTLWSLWAGIRHAIAGRIGAHRAVFRNLYWYGLLVAGTVNFLPGRRMNQAVFGGHPEAGYWLIGGVAALAIGINLYRRAARRGVLQAA